MGYKLKTLNLDGGLAMSEKACENYECRSCGSKMVSANFVTGICIQVFVSHQKNCSLFKGTAFERIKEVTCESCRYFSEGGNCTYSGEYDRRIADVRTAI